MQSIFNGLFLSFLVLTTTTISKAQNYCAASSNPTCNGSWYIQRVTLEGEKNSGINRNSLCDDYVDATHLVANIIPGTPYALEVSTVALLGNNTGLFIDWNENGDFSDPGETLLGFANSTQPAVFLVIAPQDATPGKKRMRVRATSYIGVPDACGPQDFGEVEDYTIELFESIDDVPDSPTSPGTNTYCAASGELNCSTTAGDGLDYSILNVTIFGDNNTAINNNSTCERYGDFTHLRATLTAGILYNLSIQTTATTQTIGNFGVFIDWDNDGIFNTESETYITTVQGIGNIPVLPPTNTSTGIKRVRIRRCSGLAVPTACGIQALGEVEDYTLLVINPASPVPDCAENRMPADSAKTCQSVQLSWDTVSNATDYRLFVKNQLSGATMFDTVITSNKFQLPKLDTNTTYSWLVVPREDGTEAISCDTFSFQVYKSFDPSVTINHTLNDSLETCVNSSLALSLSEQGGAVPFSYTWSGTEENHFSALNVANPSYTPGLGGSYDIRIHVSDTNGCTANDSAVVKALEKPNASGITPLKTEICLGDELTFSVPQSQDSIFAIEQQSDGSINPITTPELSQGTYTISDLNASSDVALIIFNANGCQDTSTFFKITVHAVPDVPVIKQKEFLACEGKSISLFVENMKDLAKVWSTGATTDTVFVTQSSDYSVEVTDSNGCKASSAPYSLSFNPSPQKPLIKQVEDAACAGDPVTIYVENSNGNLVEWNDALNSNGDSLLVNSSGVYRAVLTNAIGCSSESDFEIQFNPPPPRPSIELIGTPCEGNNVELSSSPAISYLWSTGETTNSILISESDTFSLKITDQNGCSNENGVMVNFLPAPQAPELSLSGKLCEGNAVELASSEGDTYLWSTGESSQSITITQSGTYSVSIRDKNGCLSQQVDSTITFASTTLTPEIVQDNNSLIADPLDSTLTYQWLDENDQLVAENKGRLDLSENGTYRVIAITDKGCASDTSEAYAFTTIGIKGRDEMLECKVYPNPGKGALNVELPQIAGAETRILIHDVTGKIVASTTSQSNPVRLNLSLEKGVYTLIIHQGERMKMVKWVCE
ncbi:MAG: GEVED domain-containing protein [Luteibaculum sp.]